MQIHLKLEHLPNRPNFGIHAKVKHQIRNFIESRSENICKFKVVKIRKNWYQKLTFLIHFFGLFRLSFWFQNSGWSSGASFIRIFNIRIWILVENIRRISGDEAPFNTTTNILNFYIKSTFLAKAWGYLIRILPFCLQSWLRLLKNQVSIRNIVKSIQNSVCFYRIIPIFLSHPTVNLLMLFK